MPYVLSIVTFLPLVGAALIVLLKLAGGRIDQDNRDRAAKWIALLTTLVSLALAGLLWLAAEVLP